MKLILVNNSSSSYSYLSGAITVSANSSTEVSCSNWFSLYTDIGFLKDVKSNNLFVNDGTVTYSTPEESLEFLQRLMEFNYNNKDTDGAPIVRIKAAKKGWYYCALPVEFSTSRLQTDSSFYSKDSNGDDRAGISLKVYDADDEEITTAGLANVNLASAVKTVIDFEPNWDYEVIGGTLRALADVSTDIRLWIIAVPDIPYNYGGSREMVGGINLNYLVPSNFYGVDGRVAKYLKYDANLHTNKLRFILRYPAGTVHNIQLNLELYRQ